MISLLNADDLGITILSCILERDIVRKFIIVECNSEISIEAPPTKFMYDTCINHESKLF